MNLRVLFFSVLRDVTGVEGVALEWSEEGGTVAELLAVLYGRFPGLEGWDGSVLVAADLAYVGRNDRLFPGQEVAIMPPVQGG